MFFLYIEISLIYKNVIKTVKKVFLYIWCFYSVFIICGTFWSIYTGIFGISVDPFLISVVFCCQICRYIVSIPGFLLSDMLDWAANRSPWCDRNGGYGQEECCWNDCRPMKSNGGGWRGLSDSEIAYNNNYYFVMDTMWVRCQRREKDGGHWQQWHWR